MTGVFAIAFTSCKDSNPVSSVADDAVKSKPPVVTGVFDGSAMKSETVEVVRTVTIIENDQGPTATCEMLGYAFGFRIGDPENGTYSVALGNVQDENGGPLVVTISNFSDDYDGNGNAGFDWESNIPVGAIKVKAGTPSTLYTYEPPTTSDEGVLSDRDSQSHVNFCYNAFLEVDKDAFPTFDREWKWDIEKDNDSGTAADDRMMLNALSEDFDVDYTITLSAEIDGYSNFAVSGTISITNPEFWNMDAEIEDVVDMLDGEELDVDCGVDFYPNGYTLGSGETLECTYSGTFDEMPDETLVNTATVTVTEDSGVLGGSATADVTFDVDDPDQINEEINECILVNDPLLGIEDYEVCLDDLVNGEYEIEETFDVRDSEELKCGEFEILNIAFFGDLEDQKAESTVYVDFECVVDVRKTAVTSFDRDWEWTIDKDNDSGSTIGDPLLLTPGQSFEVKYTISGDATPVDDNFAVNGVITIVNPAANPDAVRITDVTDKIGDVVADVDCDEVFPFDLEPGESLSCGYSADLPDGETAVNTATVTVDQTFSAFSDATATADVIFDLDDPDNETNTCIDIDDKLEGVEIYTTEICLEDLVDGEYEVTHTIDLKDYIFSPDDCGAGELENIATYTTNDDLVTDYDNSFVYFDLECEFGCTLTPGYWKTHSKYGPAPYDDNWANIPDDGEDTIFFLSGQTYYQVLWTPPAGGNPYYQLAHHWIAAYLNVLNGADIPADVLDAWNEAKVLFETNTPAQAGSLRGPAANNWRNLATILDDYNNGITGPGKCSDDGNSVD